MCANDIERSLMADVPLDMFLTFNKVRVLAKDVVIIGIFSFAAGNLEIGC